MSRFKPLIIRSRPRFNPLRPRGATYSSLVLPAAGELSWTAANRIAAFYCINPPGFGVFSLIRWPSTLLPLFVVQDGRRYALNQGAADVFAAPYEGQVLDETAVFELWTAGTSPVDLPAYTLTISPRVQLCCCSDSTPTPESAQLYYPYCHPFPIYLPLCAMT